MRSSEALEDDDPCQQSREQRKPDQAKPGKPGPDLRETNEVFPTWISQLSPRMVTRTSDQKERSKGPRQTVDDAYPSGLEDVTVSKEKPQPADPQEQDKECRLETGLRTRHGELRKLPFTPKNTLPGFNPPTTAISRSDWPSMAKVKVQADPPPDVEPVLSRFHRARMTGSKSNRTVNSGPPEKLRYSPRRHDDQRPTIETPTLSRSVSSRSSHK